MMLLRLRRLPPSPASGEGKDSNVLEPFDRNHTDPQISTGMQGIAADVSGEVLPFELPTVHVLELLEVLLAAGLHHVDIFAQQQQEVGVIGPDPQLGELDGLYLILTA